MFDRDLSEAIVKFSDFNFSQLGEAIVFGIAILVIGMLTIFAVLCLLWLCLYLFKLFLHDLPKKKSNSRKAEPVVIIPERVAESTDSDEEELVAVITAAIAMAESDYSGMKFRVVSFKRV